MLWVQSYRKHNLETAIRVKPRQKGDMETPGSPLAYNGGTGTSAGRRACATRKIRASAKGRPTICKPMGRPRRSAPQGIDTAGKPSGLMARTRRVAARRTSSLWPPLAAGFSPPDGGGGFADARRRD